VNRLKNLSRVAWKRPRSSAVWCESCPGWGFRQVHYVWAGRQAREHARVTGHVTRTQCVEIAEYRRSEPSGEAG